MQVLDEVLGYCPYCDSDRVTVAVAAERERCAKIANVAIERASHLTDKEFADGYSFACQEIEAKIRIGE